MNNYQLSIGELKRVADRLFFSLKLTKMPLAKAFERINANQITRHYDTVYGSDRNLNNKSVVDLPENFTDPIAAIIRVLRACIRDEMPTTSDIGLLIEELNEPVTLKARKEDEMIYLSRGSNLIRVTVEDAIRYINLLAENPDLKTSEPIGVCSQCNGIYMKRRTNQEYCSTRCRSEAWANAKGKNYFAAKARESRAARKAQKIGRSKTVGKIEGELSPKTTKKHRKPKKA